MEGTITTITCPSCGCAWDRTEKETTWFHLRGLKAPARCKPCRRAGKSGDAQKAAS
jgi:hypothetical protein